MDQLQTTLDRLKDPNYTGMNRCTACTIVNGAIAVVAMVVVAVALVVADAATYAVPAALAVGAASAAAIYFKGYLIPGTPRLTKKYFPMWLLGWFGKVPRAIEANRRSVDDREAGDDEPTYADLEVEEVLLRADAVEECRDGTDLCLTDEFGTAWNDQIASIRDDDVGRERLLDVLDTDEDVDIEFEEYDGAFRAKSESGILVGTWESRAAFLADVAAGQVLPDRAPRWEDASAFERGELLQGLRLFLETCPACGDALSFGTETVESCCSTHDVAAVTCNGCEQRVFEAPVQDDERAAPPT